MEKRRIQQDLVIFRDAKGDVKLRADMDKETIWATLDQVAALFGRDKSVISRHLRNIYNEAEIDKTATVAKNATVQKEGGREVARTLEYHNLDAILSVGYRVNSKQATLFRRWATKTLRDYIIKGYALNAKRLQEARSLQARQFMESKSEDATTSNSCLKRAPLCGFCDMIKR
ncbi:MAG: RhuM family protein [bacterium]|nr:RhuM family protein [bacterium]